MDSYFSTGFRVSWCNENNFSGRNDFFLTEFAEEQSRSRFNGDNDVFVKSKTGNGNTLATIGTDTSCRGDTRC